MLLFNQFTVNLTFSFKSHIKDACPCLKGGGVPQCSITEKSLAVNTAILNLSWSKQNMTKRSPLGAIFKVDITLKGL